MIESMLEPHLKRKAGASQSDVGITFLILNLQAVLQKKTDIEAKILGQNFNQLRDWRSEMAKKSSHMLLSGTLSGILKSNPDLTTAITRPPW